MRKYVSVVLICCLMLAVWPANIAKAQGGGAVPVSRWSFDEASGRTAEDSISNRDGQMEGVSRTFWAGPKESESRGVSFNGVESAKITAKVPDFDISLTGAFTISGFMHMPEALPNTWEVFLAKGPKEPGHFELYVNPSGELRFYSYELQDFGCGVVVADNTWHHFAVTYNGAQLVFYIDGVFAASHTVTGSMAVKTDVLSFGAISDGSAPYRGKLDEIRMFDYSLDAAQVAADRQSASVSGALAAWSFDENDGTGFYDISGSGYDGMTDESAWKPGIRGSCLSFVPETEFNCINVPDTSFDFSAGFTMSLWIKAPDMTNVCRTLLAKNSFTLRLTVDNKLEFFSDSLGSFFANVTVADNTWHHIAAAYNGTHITFAVDGISQPPQSTAGAISDTQGALRMGVMPDGTLPYTGFMGEVCIFEEGLTTQELRNQYSEKYSYYMVTAAGAEPSTDGLVNRWRFEGLHDRVIAEDNRTFDGIMHYGVWAAGQVGNGLKIHGFVNDWASSPALSYGEIPNYSQSPGNSFTMALWVQSADWHMINRRQTIAAKGQSGSGSYALFTDDRGFLHFQSAELGHFVSKVQLFTDSEWHHIAVTYSGTQIRLWIDGCIVQSAAVSGAIAALTAPLYLGGPTYTDYYWGMLDELAMYSRPLTTAEIGVLATQSKEAPPPAPSVGTLVAQIDCGTQTDGLDGYAADRAFDGTMGYEDNSLSSSYIFKYNTYSIYNRHYMLKSSRESASPFSYKFALPNGSYKAELYFAEGESTAAGQRAFNVDIQGERKLTGYDILADANDRFNGVKKEYAGIEVTEGMLTVDFIPVTGKAAVAGITIRKNDGEKEAAELLRTPEAPAFSKPSIKKQLRDSSSVYNRYTGKWMHFGLLQSEHEHFRYDSIAAAEMSNNGRGPWKFLGVPSGLSANDFAPDIVYDEATELYHMFTGSFGYGIRHYTNKNQSLMDWQMETLNCVPGNHTNEEWDPEVWKTGDTWHMVTVRGQYDSPDLYTWTEHNFDIQARWPLNSMWQGWDDTNNGNTAAFSENVYWIPREVYDGIGFSGTPDSFGSVPDCAINPKASFSVSGFIKAQAIGTTRVVLAKGVKGTGHFEIYLSTDNKLHFYAPDLDASNWGDFVTNGTICDDTWRHFAVTLQDGQLIFYIDGVQTALYDNVTGSVAEMTAELMFGRDVEGYYPYPGGLDEVHMYNRALEPDEVKYLSIDYTNYIDKNTVPNSENTLVFEFGGAWWSHSDQGTIMYKSEDGISNWMPTETTINVTQNSSRTADRGLTIGYDAIVQDGRCFLTYNVFCEPAPTYAGYQSKIAIQIVEVKLIDGNLCIDTNAPFDLHLTEGVDQTQKEPVSYSDTPKKTVDDYSAYTADWTGVYETAPGAAPSSLHSLRFKNSYSGADTVWSIPIDNAQNRDWTGAYYAQFYVRNNQPHPVQFGFYLCEGDGTGSANEYYYLKSGAQIYFDYRNGTIVPHTLDMDIYFRIPGNFQGYIKIPLNTASYGNIGHKYSSWDWAIGNGQLNLDTICGITPQLAYGENLDFNLDSLQISYDDDMSQSQFASKAVWTGMDMTGDEGIIYNVSEGTAFNDVIGSLSVRGDVSVKAYLGGKEKAVDWKQVISTGAMLKVTVDGQSKVYEFSVKGDVNGDGTVSVADLVELKHHIVGSRTLDGAKMLSGQFVQPDGIDAKDLVSLKKYLLGI